MTLPAATDLMDLGAQLVDAVAPGFVEVIYQLPQAERVEFVHGFLAACCGMAEQSVGFEASREAFAFMSRMPPRMAH